MKVFAICIACVIGVIAEAFSNARTPLETEITKFSSRFWLKEGFANPIDAVEAIFVLKRDQELVNSFEKTVLDLSNPKSKNFGKWMSKEEIANRLAPPAENVQLVLSYLESFGVSNQTVRVSDYKDKIFVKMPVNIAEKMLQTEFARFRSVEKRNIVLLRTTRGYSLPEDVANVVSFVDDIVRLPSIRRSRLTEGDESEDFDRVGDDFESCGVKCSGYTTPDVLQTAYSFSPLTSAAAGNSMAVAEFQFQYYDDADLADFSSACGVTVQVDTVIGGNKPAVCTSGGCVEALLDIEYIGAIGYPIPLTTIYSSTFSLLAWVDQVISMTNPPLVNSVSYGNDEVQQTSNDYMYETNTQFMVAAGLGLSILFAAGDQGVWGRTGVSTTFHPDFPAGCPWVTAVGGTNFATKSTIGEESTWDCGGGGFSDTFPIPSWQASEVSNYFTVAASVLPAPTFYNSTGRGYPDVSALGGQTNPYCVAYSGSKFGGVYGTSASCPVVAGIIAQLNNDRLAAGKSSLGFLNQIIYANPQCFNDVNDLSQNNCGSGTGFSATTGWDAATGHGSPNYACLQKVVLALA
jgi:tripeptidyl-peptidase I